MMLAISRNLLVAASVLCFAAVAFAAKAGHGDPHVNWWTWDDHAPPVGWFIIDFVIFIGLIYFLAKKGVVAMFKKRHETIKGAIDAAGSVQANVDVSVNVQASASAEGSASAGG